MRRLAMALMCLAFLGGVAAAQSSAPKPGAIVMPMAGGCGTKPADVGCMTWVCDLELGSWEQVPKAAGTTCNDGNLCTHTDKCNASGSCIGTAISCTGCKACNGTSTCGNAAAGTGCTDGNLCTYTDVCNGSGSCSGTAISCTGCKVCNGSSTCGNATAGTSCNDGNLCTYSDVCNASGACGGTGLLCGTCKVCNGTATCGNAASGSVCSSVPGFETASACTCSAGQCSNVSSTTLTGVCWDERGNMTASFVAPPGASCAATCN